MTHGYPAPGSRSVEIAMAEASGELPSIEPVGPIRVGINGFGRIGRNFFRANMAQGNPLEIVAANDLTDIQLLADQLKYDSIHRTLDADVRVDNDVVRVDEQHMRMFSEKDPTALPWGDYGVDVVIESTGRFTSSDKAAAHLEAGAKKVIISAPAKGDDVATIVMGINEESYDPAAHDIISNASCTTNSLAPLAKVFNDMFGIESGFMTTTHAYTADQNLHDGPHPDDRRRARAAGLNIIPTSTGAARAIGLVLPELAGKLEGGALRVPVPDGSLTELTVVMEANRNRVDIDDINAVYHGASEGWLRGILQYTEDPIVSGDIIGNPHSAIFDAGLTKLIGNQVQLFAWYDNEWGFSNRLVELSHYVTRGYRIPR